MEVKPESDSDPQNQKPVDLRIGSDEVDGNFSKYEVQAREEVVFILRSLMKNGARITAYLDDSDDFLLTALLKIDEESDSLMLALDSSKYLNRRAQLSSKVVCITNQGKIKIQFTLDGVNLVKLDDINAFRADIPGALIRLQRRDYFRLTIPKGKPLVCKIPVKQEDGKTVEFSANIVNISGRGLTVIVPEDLKFVVEQEFPNCRIDLPEGGTVVATMQVRSVYDVNLTGGRIIQRSGCQFVKMPNPVQHLILKYILKVESERLGQK